MKIIVLVCLLAILAFVVCLVPLKEVSYAVAVDYQDTEAYYEDEPYEDIEKYTVTEPYEDIETYRETVPLQYRKLDSFIAHGVSEKSEEAMRHRAVTYGYDLPDKIVMGDYYALYVVVQNLDDIPGTFEVRYTLTTANKSAAEKQKMLIQRTPEEFAELKREYYEGSIKLYLEPGKAGVAICPPGGIYIAPDRVPFDHKHEIIPDTKGIEKQRTVTKYRQVEKERTITKYRQVEKERTAMKQRLETRYKKVTLLEYLLQY